MIKLKDAVEKYGEYEIDEKKLENILVKPKPKSVWDLKIGDEYYFINGLGNIIWSTWDNTDVEHRRRCLGNCFLTKEEAEFEAERRKVEAELLKLGGTRDMMSLGNYDEKKYFIRYYHNNRTWEVESNTTLNPTGCIYFKTEKDCRCAIKEIGKERIKKYIFNVKE